MKKYLFLPILVFMAGCAGHEGEIGGREMDQTVHDVDVKIKESRTLSALGKLQASIADYYKTEKKIPANLERLIPKYLADMPTVEIAVRGHKDNTKVQYYPSDIMRDGQVDGTRLKDTGKWGYTFNERQVIIFVDCTHPSTRGSPWYQERGVY